MKLPENFKPDSLFFADLHLHERKEFNKVEEDVSSRLVEGVSILHQVKYLVQEYKIPLVFFLGDCFELKDRVPNHIKIMFSDALEEIPAQIFLLLGNHDFRIKKYSNLKALQLSHRVEVVDRTRVIDFEGWRVGFIPYFKEYEHFKTAWERIHKQDPHMLLLHQEFPGADYKGYTPPGDFDLVFDPKVRYLSGHIHQPVLLWNHIQYLGSPYQCHFGEAEEKKYVWLYDSTSRILHPVELEYPKFINLHVLELIDPEKVKDNYVKVYGEIAKEQRSEVDRIKKELEAAGARGITSDIKYLREVKSRIKADHKDMSNVIEQFLETIPKAQLRGLDMKRLHKIGVELLQEAKQ